MEPPATISEPTAARLTAHIAYRLYPTLTEREREAVLVALIHAGTEPEALAAQDALYAAREAVSKQLTLRSVLETNGGAA